ncbi:serine protease persephone-like [Trichoplusia ni]|uniref:Serine protease persephone-like n=1 Tax=Trichoplusia ni TaxID=7111 RepID=A0A7E5WU91_TRINI|nr:serine protease persephone-like [Trichoplusia ni]
MLVFVLIFGLFAVYVNSQDPEACVHHGNGQSGKCLPVEKCPSAKRDERFHIKKQFCSTNGTSDIKRVCCLDEEEYGTDLIKFIDSDEECMNLKVLNREPKVPSQGRKALEKCLLYQRTVIKCNATSVKTPCYFEPEIHTVGGGGVNAFEGEFPHMALLGYGKIFSETEFNCGGSLISDRFVLTAGHCTRALNVGNVTIAVFGLLSLKQTPSKRNIYGVKNIIKHPMYKPPKKYHDIALLEMDRLVTLDKFVVPACLHVGDLVDDSRAYATGWGYLGYNQDRAAVLQNIPLWKVPHDTCSLKFSPYKRHLPDGIVDASQMCYGDDGTPRDTCQGDSGGPIQIKSKNIYCMYIILGVTSFGYTTCATVGYPGVYTRVSNYVPWIESIVWP